MRQYAVVTFAPSFEFLSAYYTLEEAKEALIVHAKTDTAPLGDWMGILAFEDMGLTETYQEAVPTEELPS
jgi:hypothetical protein